MKLNPQQAPLYGHCVVTVQLADEELAVDDEGVDYFLLFAGSTQRHLTTTLRSSHDTLQALCPAHDCCEVVLVTLCSATRAISEDSKDPKCHIGHVAPLDEQRFSFVQDLAFDMAQFLVSTAGRADGLDGVLLLDECQIPLQECERLDESLALALNHITLPPGWSLLGSKRTTSTDLNPQETLLHFSARRGLCRVTRFLLQLPGARLALQLANREGHTPSAIAASRGHKDLHELLTKAETDAETDQRTETAQLFSADARVFCDLATLNTHTLTVNIRPGCDPPTLQKSVEQLLHLISHLHAKGVSVLELQLDSLHTSAECCDGVETNLPCPGRLQRAPSVSECLDSTAEGSGAVNCPADSGDTVDTVGTVDCGHGEIGNAEKDCCTFVSAPTSEIRPQEHGLGPPEDWVCLGSNCEGELCQTEEEEGREQPVVSSQSLSLCDRSEGAQGETEGGILPAAAASCGKQAKEGDRGEAAIREEQGEGQSEQEAEDSTARSREEETSSESTDLIAASGDTNTSIMGQSPSSECSEVSDASDSEMKECCQEGENVEEEVAKLIQGLCDTLCLHDETEKEGLTDPRDLPSPSLIDCGDVIDEPESAVPRLLIEGLHEGEPPPDINSQEQNQETAGGDYAAQQQQGLAPETGCHFGNCSVAVSVKELHGEDADEPSGTESTGLPLDGPENVDFRTSGSSTQETRADPLNSELSPEKMPVKRQADHDPGTAHGSSSDDEGSFRSFGSSSTEIFHPTQDSITMEDQDLPQNKITEASSARSQIDDPNDLKSNENNEHSLSVDEGLPLEPATERSQDGTEAEPQLSESIQTAAALNAEGTEEPTPELSKEDLLLDPVLSASEDKQTVEDKDGETGKSNSSDLNVEVEDSASELSAVVLSEPGPSVREESKVILPVEEDDQQEEPSDKSVEVAAEESGNVQFVLQQPKQDDSEQAADEVSAEELRAVSSPEVSETPAPNSEASTEPPVGNQMAENQEARDTADGTLESGGSATREVDVKTSEDAACDAGEEESGPAEGTDSSTIHRDREASFHQPCNTQHSGSSPSSAFPSLPSRTSSSTSCPSSAHRDSGSDLESLLNAEPGYDSIFRKNGEPVTGGDSASEVSVSCSSTDDTASVGPSSSSPEGSQGLGCSWSPEEGIQTGASTAAGLDGGGDSGGGAGDVEEEAKDRVTEVPRRSCIFRNSNRSLSPLRRHSWGPGKNNGGEAEMNQRSSIRSPGEGKPAFHRRSISWCPPEALYSSGVEVVNFHSYSLEGLSVAREELRGSTGQGPRLPEPSRMPRHDSDDRGSLVSLTEEQEDREENGRLHDPKLRRYQPLRNSCPSMSLPLTKSVSMVAISHKDIDGMRSFSCTSGSLAYSISEEEPGPLRSDTEGKSGTKVSRTFSYLKNKMYKKTREKERDKREKDKEGKEKDKKTVNGHLFVTVCSNQAAQCSQCNKSFNNKEALLCTYCNASVHKGCKDSLPVCAKVKMKLPKQQLAAQDSSTLPAVTMRNKSGGTRERPWSAILSPEDHSSLMISSSRRHTNIMTFHGNNLSKSFSISNIAGPVFDEMPIKGLRYLSQSTDSLNRTNQVTESMESLTDEEMMDGQLMGEFEAEVKELEADSWSLGVEQQYLQLLDKELVKRQDVIYELMQTEMHHIRTLRIMSEVFSKGLQKEVQLELQTVEKLFPALDDLLELHSQHLLRLLERKKESQLEEGSFIISRIGDILVSQFSGSNGESMKRVYGRFCSRHSEAVNFYKDLMTKDRRFKAFIKKKMSCSIVRRLGIPECILLVTQRITKYPVLIQRMLQHTKESEEDYDDLTDAVRLVKEVIAAVDSKVNEHEKKRRLKDFHSRLDTKSIMMMKSGQIFAREDLLRRKLIHDGALQLKNIQGRLKDVHALLLSDVLVFLQEKDQKYVFAMLDQRSTVISLQKLIVREVANKERGLFLITAGIEKPEMMEVLASSKDERNTWMQLIQEAMQSMEKDEDEGIPSETEDDKRQLETKAKEMRDMLRQKDTEIMSLLEEKVRLFRGMWEGLNPGEEASRQVEPFFRSACSQEPPRGASIMKDALQEVETLQTLVNSSLGGAMASVHEGGGAGPVCLPRRAETFGGFDSHQMHSSKSGDRDESEDAAGDLRRTESDSVLKKGGNANLLQLLKRNSEQVLDSVSNLHLLLSTLQAVVVQQDSYIEDQRQALTERSSSCASLSRQSSRPSSLIEQEKQRSLEKQRQELASLQRQQAAHAEEKRKREKEWDLREQQLTQREALVHLQEEEILKLHKSLDDEKQELQSKKEEYQKDLERLRDSQRKLERDREAMRRQLDKMEELRLSERTPSTTSDESLFLGSSQSLELDPLELSSSSSSSLPRLQPQRSKPKGKGLNPFTSSSTNLKGSEANNQISKSFLQLAKNKSKDGKEKKKKKNKGGSAQTADPQHVPEPPMDGEIFFC
ncbi:A-kinase anchor protein 13 isoform X4 [Odontesthes bonariensis]|uniref:A-kinase anchor protein 13 isoform X4 n=1 Tax=Odontesthes bonariensis TaxID=219752 RepID=UPI003F586988